VVGHWGILSDLQFTLCVWSAWSQVVKFCPCISEQAFVLRDDLRVLQGKDGKMYEDDAMIVGRTMAYVVSHKTFVKGTK
jgi:hypothetical protein